MQIRVDVFHTSALLRGGGSVIRGSSGRSLFSTWIQGWEILIQGIARCCRSRFGASKIDIRLKVQTSVRGSRSTVGNNEGGSVQETGKNQVLFLKLDYKINQL
ncbi:unnamed protein product [Mucor fragilis]